MSIKFNTLVSSQSISGRGLDSRNAFHTGCEGIIAKYLKIIIFNFIFLKIRRSDKLVKNKE